MTTGRRRQGTNRRLRLWGDESHRLPLAEQAFIKLASLWHETAAHSDPERALPKKADDTALACLLLHSEWGRQFGTAALQRADANARLASTRFPAQRLAFLDVGSWIDGLPWQLCRPAAALGGDTGYPMGRLVLSLTHHQSSIRCWMMEIAWMVRASLPIDEAVPRLLKNVADTLLGVRMAMGLASALCPTNEELDKYIESYVPPEGFADQFNERIAAFRQEGFSLSPTYFWALECRCRRMIEQAVLGYE